MSGIAGVGCAPSLLLATSAERLAWPGEEVEIAIQAGFRQMLRHIPRLFLDADSIGCQDDSLQSANSFVYLREVVNLHLVTNVAKCNGLGTSLRTDYD